MSILARAQAHSLCSNAAPGTAAGLHLVVCWRRGLPWFPCVMVLPRHGTCSASRLLGQHLVSSVTLTPSLSTPALQNDYDLATLDLPCSFLPEQLSAGQEGLAGLTALQVSCIDAAGYTTGVLLSETHGVCGSGLIHCWFCDSMGSAAGHLSAKLLLCRLQALLLSLLVCCNNCCCCCRSCASTSLLLCVMLSVPPTCQACVNCMLRWLAAWRAAALTREDCPACHN